MSQTLQSLEAKIASGQDLSSIVRTMKALAATSVRQYERAAESLDDYYRTVEMGLSVVLSSYTEIPSSRATDSRGPLLALVFGSDYGLVGRFNEQIVHYALEGYWQASREKPPGQLIAVGAGEQVVSRMEVYGRRPSEALGMPTSINAITPFVQSLLEKISRWQREEGVEKALLFYNRPELGGYRPQGETMLPVDLDRIRETRLKWESRSLPTFTMSSGRLLSSLLRQYFFVSLYRACALSLAAENTGRLAAMQAAEKNIQERLEHLRVSYQQERQAAITGELLDIVSGFRAVRGKKSGQGSSR